MIERSDSQCLWLRHGNNGSIAPVNPLDLFVSSVNEREFICDQLESIADGLPCRTDVSKVLSAMQFLRLKLPVYHNDEREGLFPMLKRRAPKSSGFDKLLARMRVFQIDDEDYALEVAAVLDELATVPIIGNPNATGYLLRGFFHGYRRYLAWMQLTILPLAYNVLDPGDLEDLREALHRVRRAAGPPPIYLVPPMC